MGKPVFNTSTFYHLLNEGWIINILTLLVAVICFVPVFITPSAAPMSIDPVSNSTGNSTNFSGDDYYNGGNSTSNSGDDYYYYIVGFDEVPFFREAAMAALIITLPSAVDLLIDMIPNGIVTYVFNEDSRPRGKQSNTLLFHLTIFEKWMYVVGVICLSTITFNPVLNYSQTTGVFEATTTLYVCFENASTVLLLCPVLSFLTRCCPTWTPTRSLVIAVMIWTASLCSSSIGMVDPTSQTALNLGFTCNTILCICSGLYFCMIILCFVNTFYFGVRYPDDERLVTSDSNSKVTTRAISEERFRNIVIGAHMTTNFFDLLLNTVWYFYSYQLTYYSLSICIYLIVAFAVIIFVTESRVRKHAVVVTMNALLESKRSYVRYISHELRTPMNAATLGLKLIMDRLQEKSDQRSMRDEEALEVFQDVQLACYTAVDILNDLLSFEKLDSGILELHKTEVSPIDFIDECIKLFASQARQHNVVLESSLENVNSFTTNDAHAQALVASDIVLMDKFKMDQVLRNLVSNALKFSPRGGVVTLTAAYISYKGDEFVSTKESTSVKQARKFSVRAPRLITPRRKLSAIYAGRGDPSISQGSEKIEGHEGDDWLQIRVTDHGAGISPENQKKLFKEVIQFNPEKLQAGGGSGFGLFISKGIVDLHNGKISVFSEGDGKGCTFTVEIPMVPRRPDLYPDSNPTTTEPTDKALFTTKEEYEPLADKPSSPQENFTLSPLQEPPTIDSRLIPVDNPSSAMSPKANAGGGSASPHKNGHSKVYRLLVVDDSRMSRKMLLKFLSSAGHKCEEAEDGRQCLEMVKACEEGEGFDAILMDFIMPYMDGPTASRELRALGYTGMILGVTGNGLQSDIAYFKRCGANHVLVKPFQIEEFSKIMEGL